MDNTVCGRCSVSKITQFRRCIFSKNIYIFRHLKLEIALAIPASNDEKYNWNNSAGQGLNPVAIVVTFYRNSFSLFLVIDLCSIYFKKKYTLWHLMSTYHTYVSDIRVILLQMYVPTANFRFSAYFDVILLTDTLILIHVISIS